MPNNYIQLLQTGVMLLLPVVLPVFILIYIFRERIPNIQVPKFLITVFAIFAGMAVVVLLFVLLVIGATSVVPLMLAP